MRGETMKHMNRMNAGREQRKLCAWQGEERVIDSICTKVQNVKGES